MLVVDRSMFEALQSDPIGLDFLELSRHIIRNQSIFTESTPSILDCDSTSKGLTTPESLNLSPPPYDEIFGDLPPAYSELNLMYRTSTRSSRYSSVQNIEMIQMQESHSENETEDIEM
ncbi:hypothetical protein HHI36_000665 [Cryptolaemus montrouzieri]|uniref:Uncharacterized protein n=1 Tax=Cryptolaemus montrouzieri TaxID=559131 RepID=A0ABD2P578_9CUCU